jgi:hypothetical protein
VPNATELVLSESIAAVPVPDNPIAWETPPVAKVKESDTAPSAVGANVTVTVQVAPGLTEVQVFTEEYTAVPTDADRVKGTLPVLVTVTGKAEVAPMATAA